MSQFDAGQAAKTVVERVSLQPRVGLVLGSGLGGLADELSGAVSMPYAEIQGFPRSTAPGHAGKLVVGRLQNVPVIAMAGRVHLYEGYSAAEVAFGIQVFHHLGAQTLVITNAAGAVNEEYRPGDFMLLRDHINLTGSNPLVGSNDDMLGPRFPDMSEPYDSALRDRARDAAQGLNIQVREGVYLGLMGPSYETPAEIRMARILGADAVGMSTVMEVIAARHMGMRVLGISCITNMGSGMVRQTLSEQDVLETASRVQGRFKALVQTVIGSIGE